jgi:hypothetical protein
MISLDQEAVQLVSVGVGRRIRSPYEQVDCFHFSMNKKRRMQVFRGSVAQVR